MRSVWAVLGAVAISAVSLGACGDDDDRGNAGALAVAFDGETIETDESITGGVVDITYTNDADDAAEVYLAKLEDGKTGSDLTDYLSSPEGEDQPPAFATINGFVDLDAGDSTVITAVLTEGTWVVGGRTHLDEDEEGEGGDEVVAEVTVTEGDTAADLPTTEGTIEAVDFGYEIDALEAGGQRVTLSNTGKEPHIFAVFGLEPDGDLEAALAYEGDGEAPGTTDFSVDLAYLDPGTEFIREVDLPAGKYGLVCFLSSPPNSEDGEPHFTLGMAKEFTVA